MSDLDETLLREPARLRKQIIVLERENRELAEALKHAIGAAEYVIKLCEDTLKCGDSPNPHVKADWLGTTAHCYAAMSFVNGARKALAAAKSALGKES